MNNAEFLDIEVSEKLWSERPSFRENAEELTPRQRLVPFALFVRRLYDFSRQMAELPFFPDPRCPESSYIFKRNENVILAFCGDDPIWYWENKDDLWELYMMRVSRNADIEESLDRDDLLAEHENIEDESDDTRNDPENLTPDPLLGVFKHFLRVLEYGHAQLEGEPYSRDTASPNSAYRFRFNEQFIIAYRCNSDSDYQPVWCWRKQKNGTWKLYRLRISVSSDIELLDSSIEQELENGTWD